MQNSKIYCEIYSNEILCTSCSLCLFQTCLLVAMLKTRNEIITKILFIGNEDYYYYKYVVTVLSGPFDNNFFSKENFIKL